MDLALLLKLQDVDNDIMKLEASIGDLPVQVEHLKLQVETVENELSQKNEELSQCNETNRKLEGKIDLLNEKLKKYEEQVYSVTTNKEYDAISTEIEIKEREIEDGETQILELLEKVESLKKHIQKKEEQLERIKKELNEKSIILAEKTKENEQELKKLSEARELFVDKIERPIYHNYERIRKKRYGMAIAEIKNYTCEGCFATIPAQTVVEVRKMNNLIHCETCGRVLYCTNNKNDTIKIE